MRGEVGQINDWVIRFYCAKWSRFKCFFAHFLMQYIYIISRYLCFHYLGLNGYPSDFIKCHLI